MLGALAAAEGGVVCAEEEGQDADAWGGEDGCWRGSGDDGGEDGKDLLGVVAGEATVEDVKAAYVSCTELQLG